MMKQRRELGLRRFWSAVRSSNSSSGSQCEQGPQGDEPPAVEPKPERQCSLPLLQVWPSADSPRGEADGQSFVFPEDAAPARLDAHNDSGIDSNQASPQPPPAQPAATPPPSRRPSCALLHPDDARSLRAPPSPTLSSNSESSSSLNSIAKPPADGGAARRPSTLTARYSIFDALDLEYALLRAAARGSVGPCSLLGGSVHKLTFTQSLAFPALARGVAATRRGADGAPRRARAGAAAAGGLNAFAKCVTALVLVLVSVLVFAVVYKFVRT